MRQAVAAIDTLLARAPSPATATQPPPDTAATTSSFAYDARRRLWTVQTYRGTPAIWSADPPAYTPAPSTSGPPTTLQLLLEDGQYKYDVVDNPVEIDDWRIASEWPAGAQAFFAVVELGPTMSATL